MFEYFNEEWFNKILRKKIINPGNENAIVCFMNNESGDVVAKRFRETLQRKLSEIDKNNYDRKFPIYVTINTDKCAGDLVNEFNVSESVEVRIFSGGQVIKSYTSGNIDIDKLTDMIIKEGE